MSLCKCDTLESIRITNEIGNNGPNGSAGFRPRCGECGGKLPEHGLPASLVKQLPDPDEIPDSLVRAAQQELRTDDARVNVTITITNPSPDVDDSLDVAIEQWDNPHRMLED